MINKGLFGKLYINSVQSDLELDDQGEGRMATLSQAWNDRDAASVESLWATFIKRALGYLEFVPPATPPNKNGLLPLYNDWGFANCICVLCTVRPQMDINSTQLGSFWPGKLIGELKKRKLRWGILTDGASFRLYSTKSSKPYEDYVELDLAETLQKHDKQEYALFEHFFHAGSFMAEEAENQNEAEKEKAVGIYKCQLDRKREESEATLESLVKAPFLFQIDEVLQYLCNGFIHDTQKSGEEYSEEERREIFESAVKLLYRCLFLFYAESRSLLPSEQGKEQQYGERSIRALCREAHKFRWSLRNDFEEYGMWKHLKGLTNAVNDGDPDYGIIGYNGGLFDDEEERFLGHHRIRNDFLARALYLLAYVEPADADPKTEYEFPYEDLEVRHLGELYENILEFNVTLADADRVRRRSKNGVEILLLSETEFKTGDSPIRKGEVYFSETALERKQSGSYYTPESLVHFLNAKAIIEPLKEKFEKHRGRFEEFLEQTGSGYDQPTSRGALQSAIAIVHLFVQEQVLRFKLCDPAMGSGHFLVNAANQMTEFVVGLFDEIPQLEGLQAEISCKPNYWRRLITRHCLYGVDLNPLATHLAKLSLWLNCFARDHKLTFLDHHLRCGNSLIGVRSFQQLENIPQRNNERTKKDTQLLFLPITDELRDKLRNAAQTIAGIGQLDEDDTDRQRDLYIEAYQAAIKYIAPLADLHTAYLMDQGISKDEYWNLFRAITKGNFDEIENALELHDTWESVKTLRGRHAFFHWMLEFSDVFGSDTEGGFSANIGNPPWDTVLPNSQEFFSVYDPKFRSYKKQKATRVANMLMKDNPAIAKKWMDYGNDFTQQIAYFKESVNYSSIGKVHVNTYKLFLEIFFITLCDGGFMGIVVPSGFYTDQGCQPLRQRFFTQSGVKFLYGFENRWPTVFNAVDGRFKFITFCTQKGGKTDKFKCTFMGHNPERLPLMDLSALQLTFEQVRKFSPDTLGIMEFDNQREINIAAAIYHDNPLLGNYLKTNWQVFFQDEFNITHDTKLFLTEEECSGAEVIPLWEGKQIWVLTHDFAAPTRWMLKSNAEIKPTTHNTRVAYRSVASNTNERTLIPAVIPASFPTGHSIDVCPLPPSIAIKIAAIVGSFVIDWILRKKVTTNINKFITAQLPILEEIKNSNTESIFDLILAMGSRLICTTSTFSKIWNVCYSPKWNNPEFWYNNNVPIIDYGPTCEQEIRSRLRDEASKLTPEWCFHCGVHNRFPDRRDTGDRAQLRAEIDANVAHLYGLSRDDFIYILDTFPVLKNKEEKTFGEFMSKRKCLEEYDRIAQTL